MSCCDAILQHIQSTEETRIAKKRSKEIDQQLKLEKKRNANFLRKTVTAIILGPADSGKTTVLKQLKLLKGNGFDAEEREFYKEKIRENLRNCVLDLSKFHKYHSGVYASDDAENAVKTLQEMCANFKDQPLSNIQVAELMRTILKDEKIIKLRHHHAMSYLGTQMQHVFDNFERISSDNFIPTDNDILFTRSATTRISCSSFQLEFLKLNVFDVAGHLSQRHAWIPFFSKANALIYVCDISSFDLRMEESSTHNRLADSLQQFHTICRNPLLENVHIILLLNKTDLLKEKVQAGLHSMADFFPKFTGNCSYHGYVKFIKQQLTEMDPNKKRKRFVFETHATDMQMMKNVVESLLDILCKKAVNDVY